MGFVISINKRKQSPTDNLMRELADRLKDPRISSGGLVMPSLLKQKEQGKIKKILTKLKDPFVVPGPLPPHKRSKYL
jgi:hypothetical protein